MSITNHNNQRLRVFGILSIGLVLLSGCQSSSLNPLAGRERVLPGLGQPVRVSSGDADAAEPAIASSPDGSLYVAWVVHGQNRQADVMIARFTSDGRIQGSAVRVNSPPGIATAWRGDPPTVAVAPDHTVYVGWTARVVSKSGHATDLYLSSSRDHGQTFAAPVKVNDDDRPAVHGMHSLAIGSDGRVYVAWLDERNMAPVPSMKMDAKTSGHHVESNRDVFTAASNDGGRTFSANQRVAANACPCCKVALAVNSSGRLYISWRQVLPDDFRHIAVAASPDQGKTFTTPVIVSDDQWVLSGCPVSGSTLSISNDGKLRVLWYSEGDNGRTGLYWSESRDNGATFGPRQLVAAGKARGTSVLVRDGAVWQGVESSPNIMIAPRIAEGGEATMPGIFVVARDGELPAATANNERFLLLTLERAIRVRTFG